MGDMILGQQKQYVTSSQTDRCHLPYPTPTLSLHFNYIYNNANISSSPPFPSHASKSFHISTSVVTEHRATVVVTNPMLDGISLVRNPKPAADFSGLPEVDLSRPVAEVGTAIVEACEDFGFFKVTNHGIPVEVMAQLEEEAVRFFSLPELEKQRGKLAFPFVYGSKRIGPNGDVGWVEYLLFQITSQSVSHQSLDFLRESSASSFGSALNHYLTAMRKLTGEVLELIAVGLQIQPRNYFSQLVSAEGSDIILRLNHYPPRPALQGLHNCSITGFGEHTDPQLISILRSNNSTGLQIALRDGTWVPVPPDPGTFFINIGDSLQVMTNKRLRSVKHRVLANGLRSRVSMIYFAGPTQIERIAPLPQLMGEGEQSLYREFTWAEYRRAAYKSRLSDNRLAPFERQ